MSACEPRETRDTKIPTPCSRPVTEWLAINEQYITVMLSIINLYIVMYMLLLYSHNL